MTRGRDRFFGLWRGTLVPLALPRGAQIDAGEDQRQLGRTHFDRHGIAVGHSFGKLERADLKSFVPDRQPITAIPVEDLEAIAASIDEEKQVAGREILAKGGGHQSGKRVEAFAEVG